MQQMPRDMAMQRNFHCQDTTFQAPARCAGELLNFGYRSADERTSEVHATRSRVRTVVEPLVEQVFGILKTELSAATRGRAQVALARQVAMYLTHVVCQLSFTDVGRAFARDRTTVAHACSVVEDLRDDPHFDRALELLEAVLLFRMKMSVPLFSLSAEART